TASRGLHVGHAHAAQPGCLALRGPNYLHLARHDGGGEDRAFPRVTLAVGDIAPGDFLDKTVAIEHARTGRYVRVSVRHTDELLLAACEAPFHIQGAALRTWIAGKRPARTPARSRGNSGSLLRFGEADLIGVEETGAQKAICLLLGPLDDLAKSANAPF